MYLVPEAERVPFNTIVEGTRVHVPVWKTGSVTGWTNGTIIKISTPLHAEINDVFFIVRHDVTDTEQGYFHWSLAKVQPVTYQVDLCPNCFIVAENDDWSGVGENDPRPLHLIPRADRVVIVGNVTFFSNQDCGGCGALPGDRLAAVVYQDDKK